MDHQPLAFVTGNAGKFATAVEHLRPLGIRLEQLPLDLDEIQSVHTEAVARHKAGQAFNALRRPLIVEDSGFGLDELGGYPGPMIKHTLAAIGASGIARLADLTKLRTCRFSSTLVFADADGTVQVFTDDGNPCTVAAAPAPGGPGAGWSELWDVVVPAGGTAPLSSQPSAERDAEAARWILNSVFHRFGQWYAADGGAASARDQSRAPR